MPESATTVRTATAVCRPGKRPNAMPSLLTREMEKPGNTCRDSPGASRARTTAFAIWSATSTRRARIAKRRHRLAPSRRRRRATARSSASRVLVGLAEVTPCPIRLDRSEAADEVHDQRTGDVHDDQRHDGRQVEDAHRRGDPPEEVEEPIRALVEEIVDGPPERADRRRRDPAEEDPDEQDDDVHREEGVDIGDRIVLHVAAVPAGGELPGAAAPPGSSAARA